MLPPRSKYAQDSLFPTVMGALAYYAGRRQKKRLGLVSYTATCLTTKRWTAPAFLSATAPRSVIGIVVTVQHSQTFERKALRTALAGAQ